LQPIIICPVSESFSKKVISLTSIAALLFAVYFPIANEQQLPGEWALIRKECFKIQKTVLECRSQKLDIIIVQDIDTIQRRRHRLAAGLGYGRLLAIICPHEHGLLLLLLLEDCIINANRLTQFSMCIFRYNASNEKSEVAIVERIQQTLHYRRFLSICDTGFQENEIENIKRL
jgi:hypothetical protein